MLKDVVQARPLEGHQLYVRFEDGVEGVVDLAQLIHFEGVFAPLLDRCQFVQVQVSADLGTVYWPNGADLDPDVLYAHVTGRSIPQLERKPQVA